MDDEAFLDDEIYDDDPDHHPVDDDDLGVLGGLACPPTLGRRPDLQPASCFTPEYLARRGHRQPRGVHLPGDARGHHGRGPLWRRPTYARPRAAPPQQQRPPRDARFRERFPATHRALDRAFRGRGPRGVVACRPPRPRRRLQRSLRRLPRSPSSTICRWSTGEGNRAEDPDAPDYLGMCPRLSSLSSRGTRSADEPITDASSAAPSRD